MNILYVNEQLVDLNPSQQISITITGIKAGELDIREVSFTNSFTVPDTENNDQLFGYTKSEKSRGSFPYQLQDFKLIQNGIETFKGKCICKSFKGGYKLQLLENIFDVFASVREKEFKELLTYGVSGWEAADIDAARLNTEGIMTAMVYWGKPDGSTPYNADFFLPSFYYHTAIKSILQATGFAISGDILTDTRFTDLIIPFPGDKFEYNESDLSDDSYSESFTWNNVVNTDTLEQFDEIFWTKNYAGRVHITLTIDTQSITLNDGSYLRFSVRKNNVVQDYVNTTTVFTYTLELDVDLEEGDEIDVIVTSDAPATGVTSAGDATLRLTQLSDVVLTNVNWDLLWPEIKCIDLLQDFFVRFGVILKDDNGTASLDYLERIIGDRFTITDWREKLTLSESEIDFQTKMAQNNYFTYNDQTNDDRFGSGTIEIDNNTLPVEEDVFDSPFETCPEYSNDTYSMQIAELLVYDSTSEDIADFKNSPGLKLLTLKDRTTETGIIFNVSLRTDYKLGYFFDPDLTKDTSFQYFVDQFYSKYSQALQKYKLVTKYYNLDQLDIKNFDKHRMIFDGEGYYLLEKLNNFIPDKITKVDLFKVADPRFVIPIEVEVTIEDDKDSVSGTLENVAADNVIDVTIDDDKDSVSGTIETIGVTLFITTQTNTSNEARIYYKINGGSWTLLLQTTVPTYPSYTELSAYKIGVVSGDTVYVGVRNETDTGDLTFDLTNSPSASYTGFSGLDTGTGFTVTANVNKYVNIATF